MVVPLISLGLHVSFDREFEEAPGPHSRRLMEFKGDALLELSITAVHPCENSAFWSHGKHLQILYERQIRHTNCVFPVESRESNLGLVNPTLTPLWQPK